MVTQFDKVKLVEIEALQLDFKNPRLALTRMYSGEGDFLEDTLISNLHEEADLQEIITSILQNGYVPVEPLIAIFENDKYRILEGNRRLAAIKLIHEPELRNKVGISVDQGKVTEKILETIKEIPVYVVDAVEEAKALIGFKHIKGPYKWNSFAKAHYVTTQYKEGKSIEDISKAIGDTNQTVRNLIGGMIVLEQAIEEDLFKVSDKSKPGPFGFSHLYTALGRTEYKNYLGLESGWDKEPSLRPIPNENLNQLKEVLLYLYGSKSEDKESLIKSQNPDLKRLGETIAHKEGLKNLQAGANLNDAFEETKEDEEVFESAIRKALNAVNHAQGVLTKYDGKDEDALSIVEKILRGAKTLEQAVQRQHKEHLADNEAKQ